MFDAKRSAPRLALVALVLVCTLPLAWSSFYQPDELNALYDAKRIAGGEAMYRDFFEFVAPWSYWLSALLFALAGAKLWVARLGLVGALGATAGLLHALARRLGVGAWWALLPAAIFLACLFPVQPLWVHHWIALPFALGATLAGVDALQGHGRGRWLLAGLLGGFAFATTQTDGVVVLAALAAMALARPGRGRALGALALGAALPLAGMAAVLAWQGALGAAYLDVVAWPAAHYRRTGGFNDTFYASDLPVLVAIATPEWHGRLDWAMRVVNALALYGLPPGVVAYTLAWGLGLALRRGVQAAEWARLLVLLVAAGLLAVEVRGRMDEVHAAFYAAPAMLVAAELAWRSWQARAVASAPVRLLPLAVLLLYVASGLWRTVGRIERHPERYLRVASPDARLAASPLVSYLRAHGRPGDRIAALPLGGYAYFFGLPSAVDMNLLLPRADRYNDEADYQRYWAQLAANRPRYVVVSTDHGQRAEVDQYLVYPLPGYREVAALRHPRALDETVAFIFERVDAPNPASPTVPTASPTPAPGPSASVPARR